MEMPCTSPSEGPSSGCQSNYCAPVAFPTTRSLYQRAIRFKGIRRTSSVAPRSCGVSLIMLDHNWGIAKQICHCTF